MSTEEPSPKKVKTGWEDHKLNCSEAFVKCEEGRSFTGLADEHVSALQGIGQYSSRILEVLGIETVSDLGTYKYYLLARALSTMAETETDGGRPSGSVMNVDRAVVAEYESKTLKEIVASPVQALEGISDDAAELLGSLGARTVGDLAGLKYFRWAEAAVLLGQYEFTRTEQERKQDRLLKKLE